MYQLMQSQLIPYSRKEVFAFFSDAKNLEKITPSFLHFQILTPEPISMQSGTLIDYKLRLFGVPTKWRTRIERFEPEECFVDTQVKGPYKYWHHLHEFWEVPGGTKMYDVVDYGVPFQPIGGLVQKTLIHYTLQQIFSFRHKAIQEIFS